MLMTIPSASGMPIGDRVIILLNIIVIVVTVRVKQCCIPNILLRYMALVTMRLFNIVFTAFAWKQVVSNAQPTLQAT